MMICDIEGLYEKVCNKAVTILNFMGINLWVRGDKIPCTSQGKNTNSLI